MFSCNQRSCPVTTDTVDFVHPEDCESYEPNENYESYEPNEDYDSCEPNEDNGSYDPEGDNQGDVSYSIDKLGEESFSCDTCDRDFYSKAQFDKHMSEHRVCNLDGCTFTAHEKVIEKHIRMQHSTGLYDKIRNINTPEDIAKWIEERKKRYPTRENIEERQKKQEEKLKRGERIAKNNNMFGKNKYRLSKTQENKDRRNQKVVRKRKIPPKPAKVTSLINEKSDWNGNMFPFRGTSELYEEEVEKEVSDYEDDEWSAPTSNTVIKLNNALGALMGAYMSDDEFDEVVPETNNVQEVVSNKPAEASVKENKPALEESTTITTNEDQDDEPPTETRIEKEPLANCSTSAESSTVNRKQQGRKRKRIVNRNKSDKRGNSKIPKKTDDFPYDTFTRRKATLLEKLLENEIRHERNVLLQCVRYFVSNDFFMDK